MCSSRCVCHRLKNDLQRFWRRIGRVRRPHGHPNLPTLMLCVPVTITTRGFTGLLLFFHYLLAYSQCFAAIPLSASHLSMPCLRSLSFTGLAKIAVYQQTQTCILFFTIISSVIEWCMMSDATLRTILYCVYKNDPPHGK
jgi:hypothetical protein